MPITHTDAILWYDVGEFGKAGYAIPNPSDDVGTLNSTILNLVDLVGQNLQYVMHQEDVDFQSPPSMNVIRDIHRLYLRVSQIINARAVPFNETELRTVHSTMGHEVFKVYPAPYFNVRNPYLKDWARLCFSALSDMIQHTENRKSFEITEGFRRDVGPIFRRCYELMAMQLFSKTREDVAADGFVLTDADFASYDPGSWHTRTEMMDTVPPLAHRFTEDQLKPLRRGIPLTHLPADVKPWPDLIPALHGGEPGSSTSSSRSSGLPRNR